MLEQILTIGFFTAFFSAMVRMAVPLIYAGLGEMFAEKAGILNIGMEGVMLSGAFCSFAQRIRTGGVGRRAAGYPAVSQALCRLFVERAYRGQHPAQSARHGGFYA